MGTREADQDQIDKLISKLREDKSPGLDGITAEQQIFGQILVTVFTACIAIYCYIIRGMNRYIIHHQFY